MGQGLDVSLKRSGRERSYRLFAETSCALIARRLQSLTILMEGDRGVMDHLKLRSIAAKESQKHKQEQAMTKNADGSFAGKVAFVTGAANGIGRAAALAFAGESASVVVADVSDQDNQETVRLIEKQGGRALAVR